MSKKEFVLKFPDKKPSEIVQLAKGEGIDIDPKYVSVIRYNEKTAGQKKSAPKSGAPKSVPVPSSVPAALRDAILHHGIGATKAVLKELGA